MKNFLTFALLGVGAQALPPGYEGQHWCPPDNCEIFTNPYGYDAGPMSSFFKCYNPTTDETTEGAWIGSLTNTTAPDGWIQPDTCSGAEWSQCDDDSDCSLEIDQGCTCYVSSSFYPFNPCEGIDTPECNNNHCMGDECNQDEPKCVQGSDGSGGTCEIDRVGSDDVHGGDDEKRSGNHSSFPTSAPTSPSENKIPAMCDADSQCSTQIRARAPVDYTGVGICGCFASSELQPFDQCEGQDLSCVIFHSRCASPGSCQGYEAYCDISPNDNGMGECRLRPSPSRSDILKQD